MILDSNKTMTRAYQKDNDQAPGKEHKKLRHQQDNEQEPGKEHHDLRHQQDNDMSLPERQWAGLRPEQRQCSTSSCFHHYKTNKPFVSCFDMYVKYNQQKRSETSWRFVNTV